MITAISGVIASGIASAIPPTNTINPLISGTNVVGNTLSTTNGTWSGTAPITYTYQWRRNGSNIVGATASTYTLVQADATTSITCVVTATNLAGTGFSISNALTIFDSNANAFIVAESGAGVSLTPTQQNAINQWVVDAKAAGIWTKFKAVYPMVGGTATAHKFNLINPADTNAAFRLQFFGGGTHSANGYLPNGSNAYANTFCASNNMALNSANISYYSRTNTTTNTGTELTSFGVSNSELSIKVSTAGGVARINMTGAIGYTAVADSSGLFMSNRTASNSTKFIRNAILLNNYTNASTSVSTTSFFLGAGSNSGSPFSYSRIECAFATIGDGLTDLESQLFYQITEKYQVALGRNINPTQSFYYNSAYNNETNAFLFSTQITDNTIQTATNTLVADLKTANIWTKMKAIYPMVGGSATTHKFNLVNAQDTDAAFRLSFVGGWTHSANGALPNGTNAYANTFCATNNMALNSIHLSYYSRTNLGSAGTAQISSVYTSAAPNSTSQMLIKDAYIRLNQTGTITSVTNTTTLGLHTATRTASNLLKLNKNGSTIGTWTNASAATSTIPLYIAANNQNNTTINSYTSAQCAFASIGDGLTDAEALAFYNAVQNFNTTLGRQV